MPGRLAEYLSHIHEEDARPDEAAADTALRERLGRICSVLRVSTGHDFRQYKEPTLVRRVQRRLQVLRIDDVDEYVERLRNDQKEARQLFRELLVSVTGFFRDAEAFEALDREVLGPLVEAKTSDQTVRVWVPGCATGEEAYSIAIALKDRIDTSGKPLRLQVFATDIDDRALEVARRGLYPEGIINNVPEPYLKRYFRSRGSDYEVVQEIREVCIFSTQSLVKDPPFSKMDLISCRNVLIYLRPELQNRLIPVFHYALKPKGHLFLGTSENVTRHAKLFDMVDKKWRVFQRREGEERPELRFPLVGLEPPEQSERAEPAPERQRSPAELGAQLADRAIIEELGPAFALIGEGRDLLYSGGPVERYLSLPRGSASLEVLSLVREDLRMYVRALLHRAGNQPGDAERERVIVAASDGPRYLRLVCRRLADERLASPQYLLVFQDLGPAADAETAESGHVHDDDRIRSLETELRTTKEYLQTTTEELESSNEELKSANEELMSMNEELQSSNEELETSKEELQSINEELETVNAELSNKVDELGRSNADLENLLESTRIATLFLDRKLCVRKFTPVAQEIFHLIGSDVGRSIEDINAKVTDIDLAADARGVLDTLSPVEREVRLRGGERSFLMRLLPYRTAEDVIDGVVATFFDVSTLQAARRELSASNALLKGKIADLEAVLGLAPVGIAFTDDPACRTIALNEHGAALLGTARASTPAGSKGGYRVLQNGRELGAEELPLQRVWASGEAVHDFRAMVEAADGRRFEIVMSAAPIFDAEGRVCRVVGIYDDVSAVVEARDLAERRAVQQDAVAKLGLASLKGEVEGHALDTVPARVATILDVEFAKLLGIRPGDGDFTLWASHGFDAPLGTIVPGGAMSQAGYTVEAGGPVIVEDLATERRFTGPPLLRDTGVVSGISVPIGDPSNPKGVLGVHTRTRRAFSLDEVQFLQSVANVVAATLEREAADARQAMLLRELRHRVKNILATVSALARLSFRDRSEQEYAFLGRLKALAEAHDLTFASDWQEVDFADVLAGQLGPFRDAPGVSIAGDRGVRLAPQTAIDVGMLLHELVTNASKHGALAGEDGRLDIAWRLDRERLALDWRERADWIAPPERSGVGTKTMDAVSRNNGFSLDRRFETGLMTLSLGLPLLSG
ncbi:MAG: CheR family methyltransferase [Paracoccaceae bacterium]